MKASELMVGDYIITPLQKGTVIGNKPELRMIRANTFRKTKMKKVEVFENDHSLGVFESQIRAAEFLGVSHSLISVCARKGTKSKKGLTVKEI